MSSPFFRIQGDEAHEYVCNKNLFLDEVASQLPYYFIEINAHWKLLERGTISVPIVAGGKTARYQTNAVELPVLSRLFNNLLSSFTVEI